MAYHTPLTNSQEFTAALQMARKLAEDITESMRKIPGTSPDFEVFPYTYVVPISHAPPQRCGSFLSLLMQNWTLNLSSTLLLSFFQGN